MPWLLLVLSLPTENATARMRAWRTLKAFGAIALRDGVYVLPSRGEHDAVLVAVAEDVRENGGHAYVLHTQGPDTKGFAALFDRSKEYSTLLAEIAKSRATLSGESALETLKQARKLRKAFAQLLAIDFFPSEIQKHTDAALQELEIAANRALSPNEPHPEARSLPRLSRSEYQGRLWATRRRPWVDRLASAWLIGRFIDPAARFLWLASPSDCPAGVVGFDFDGASFTHVGEKVTFETLLASFELDSPALHRMGQLVHYLDVGGPQPPEASGVELILMGLRETFTDDNQLLAAASQVFDGLLAAFARGD